MEMSVSSDELQEYIRRQLDSFFPDKYHFRGIDVDQALKVALERTEYCFKFISNRSYYRNGQQYFSYLHSDQYAQFLFFLSSSLWQISENRPLCDKIIYLNKALNAFFFSYKCKLPDIFFFAHPVGSILGNATYSDFLVVSQNVTINTYPDTNGIEGNIPILGKDLYLGAGAKVIGGETIGNRVSIGVDAIVYNQNIPDDAVVLLENGKNIIRQRKKYNVKHRIFLTLISHK